MPIINLIISLELNDQPHLVLQKKIVMGNLKNLFFVAAFMLLGFGVQANTTLYTISDYDTSLTAPQGDGVVNITQGLHGIVVDILVSGPVKIKVLNEDGTLKFKRFVPSPVRRVKISTKSYKSGTYTLAAKSTAGVQTIDFVVAE